DVDLEARLANKRTEEQRLLRHMSESPARLTDILAVEKELSRVREEAERMQGRLQVLASQTAFSTVTVTANEVKEFTPARRTTFAAQIGRTWDDSLGAMRQFGACLALTAVALAPWLVLLAVLAAPLRW